MAYWEVIIIIEGEFDQIIRFDEPPGSVILPEVAIAYWLEDLKSQVEEDEKYRQVYMMYHEHSIDLKGCTCAQYQSNYQPNYKWSVSGGKSLK